MEACIFCKIIQREEPSYILDENEDVLVFLSPENHPLVVPKKHIPDIYALDERTAAAIRVEAVIIARAVKPRWRNDTVILYWDTHPVSAEDLRASMEKIQEALQ